MARMEDQGLRKQGGQGMTTATRNGAILTAQEVTVQTAQVEISVMRVGKKQVTQAMFRQIPYKALIDLETLTLRGRPWGYVRYWWEGCSPGLGRAEDGLHVLWQDGETLRRALVFDDVITPPQQALSQQQQWAINGAFILADRATTEVRELRSYRSSGSDWSIAGVEYRVTLELGDRATVEEYWRTKERPCAVDRQEIYLDVRLTRENIARQARDPRYEFAQRHAQEELLRYQQYSIDAEVDERVRNTLEHQQRHWQSCQQAYAALVTREGLEGYTSERCLAAHAEAGMGFQAMTSQYRALVRKLRALPQLFIAV
jgi:hypothetical protein